MSSIKEPGYFLFDHRERPPRPLTDDRRINTKSVPDRARYERLFEGVGSAAGDVTPLYLYTPETPALIKAEIPEARIVAILREPTERAYSHFAYVNNNLPPEALPDAFAAAVEAELPLPDTPYKSGTHFLRLGRYAHQLARYADCFRADRMLLASYTDLAKDPERLLSRLCRFLGVDDRFAFDTSIRFNRARAGSGAANRPVLRLAPYLKRVLPPGLAGRAAAKVQKSRAQRANAASADLPPMHAATHSRLTDYYLPDLQQVASEFGVDFRR